MNKSILVLGGTGFFGICAVRRLLEAGHDVTIATRGNAADPFGGRTSRITVERTSAESIAAALAGRSFDIVVDNLVFCSNDVKYLLDTVRTGRYVYSSTIAVYDEDLRMDMPESHFDQLSPGLVWCGRGDLPYGERKRQAERAVFQEYAHIPSAALRLPYVIGDDDITKRLYFYVEHIVKGFPMHIDNMDEKLSFIYSDEAGEFLAWAALHEFTGALNGANSGSISVGDIIRYVEGKTGKRAVLNPDGDPGAYNGRWAFSTSVKRANKLGFHFRDLFSGFFPLLDRYINACA